VKRREYLALAVIVLGLLSTSPVPARAAPASEDAACAAFAAKWTGSPFYLTVGAAAVLSGCAVSERFEWFLPDGPNDPRLVGGPPLEAAARNRAAPLRRQLLAQLDDLDAWLAQQPDPLVRVGEPGTLKDRVYALYDPANHAVRGHGPAREDVPLGFRRSYEQALVDFLGDPAHAALNTYAVWWFQRRWAAFPDTVCQRAVPFFCAAARQELGTQNGPWPWDLRDELTMQTYLKWVLTGGLPADGSEGAIG